MHTLFQRLAVFATNLSVSVGLFGVASSFAQSSRPHTIDTCYTSLNAFLTPHVVLVTPLTFRISLSSSTPASAKEPYDNTSNSFTSTIATTDESKDNINIKFNDSETKIQRQAIGECGGGGGAAAASSHLTKACAGKIDRSEII